MEVPHGYQGDVEVQRGTVNHMQLLERDADVRQPFRQGWKWSRIFPGGNFRPKQIRFTGEEKVLERLPTNPTVEDFLQTLHYRRNDWLSCGSNNSVCKTVFGQIKGQPQTTFKSTWMEINRYGWNVDILSNTNTDGCCAQTKTSHVLVYRQHFGNTNLQSGYEEGQIFSSCQIFPLLLTTPSTTQLILTEINFTTSEKL